jgi:C-terminal processing protease CtpA/Prc
VWGKIRYLDPWVVEGRVDWDAALVGALPGALAAKTDDEAVAAVRVLLDALHDPATRVEHDAEEHAPVAALRPPAVAQTVDGVRVIPLGVSEWSDVEPATERVAGELATAKLAVIDLRVPSRREVYVVQRVIDKLAPLLPSHDATGLAARVVEHRGYAPQTGITSGGYQTMLTSALPVTYPAAKKHHASRVVFLTDGRAGVPDLAWAMQQTGDAAIVVQGSLVLDELAGAEVVPLGAGYSAHLRRAELLGPAPRPDVQLDAGAPEAKVLQAAVQAARARPVARTHDRATREPALASRPDATYPDEPYPSREHRLLALYRFWNVIELFYPYLPLMGDVWQDALPEFIPRFEAATDAHEYALLVAELAARIPDGHVGVWGSKELRSLFGAARAPFEVRMIEGQPTVTSLQGDVPERAGAAVGDVVVAVDGEPLAARMQRLAKYMAASNDSWRAYRTLRTALTGEEGSVMKLTLRDRAGATRDVSVPRIRNRPFKERTDPVYRLLEDGIGYADLDRLQNSEVDAMFSAFEKTRAIVFDMRGYPGGTAWTIAPRLNVRHAKVGAQFFEPLVTVGNADASFFEQGISPTDRPVYQGKTVMLIDERTMSQAEHTGLFFEAVAGTTFVGSQTAGANGDVTNLALPGGLYVSFSGHDVRHADGRQLQRTGLVPDVPVHPTLEGIRAGRDEVLERAIAFIRTGK